MSTQEKNVTEDPTTFKQCIRRYRKSTDVELTVTNIPDSESEEPDEHDNTSRRKRVHIRVEGQYYEETIDTTFYPTDLRYEVALAVGYRRVVKDFHLNTPENMSPEVIDLVRQISEDIQFPLPKRR